MNLLVRRSARKQLAELPDVAARRIVEGLRVLAAVPHSGIGLEIDGFYEKVVIIKRRRWSYRLVYELCGNDLILHYIDPAWRKRRAGEIERT